MNHGVMNWLILAAYCFSLVCQTVSKCPNRGVPGSRGIRPSKVLDMDFLMDVHYPQALEQPGDTVAKAYPFSEHLDHLVTSFVSLSTTDKPVWEHRGVIDSEVKTHPRQLDQSSLGKFIKNHAEEMKRDFMTMMHFRKTRQANSKITWSRRHRINPHIHNPHSRAKRFFASRKIHHFPKARRVKIDPSANLSWTPWRTNGHLVKVTKRDTSNRRMKLSDILTRAGLKKDKEEAIKVVLPLLLSDLKDTPAKNANTLSATNIGQDLQSHVISASSGRQMRNFKVKGDDGREFSFSASASDVQQLMDILAKPNSSVVLEKVTLDKNRLKTQTGGTKPPGRKKTPSSNKAKDGVTSENVNNTETFQLKEFESSVYESIVQLDVPSKQPKLTSSSSTTNTSSSTSDSETTICSDTAGA